VLRQEPKVDDKGKLSRLPADVCKRAIRTEELLLKDKTGYADTAYAAGLLFDLLILAAEGVGAADVKATQAYIDLVFAHGLKTAAIGMELAKLLPDFAFKKYVFSACLIHDAGKAAMAIVDPEYAKFVDQTHKKGIPRAVRLFCERERFGVHHAVVGSLLCRSHRIFRPIERAILHHHDPYVLRSASKGLFELASLVSLASNIANHFKKTDKTDDPIWGSWRGPELKDFRIDPRGILKVVAKLNF
jgi:HD-like signal output (HDOD) protein